MAQNTTAQGPGGSPAGAISIGENSELQIAFHLAERVRDESGPTNQPLAERVQEGPPIPLKKTGNMSYELAIRELQAMAIQVRSTRYNFKLMILVGGVNAADPESRLGQDYYVSSIQGWIYGISVGEDRMRQFVAIRSGTPYSVQHQMTGSGGVIGEIEIRIFAQHGIFLEDQKKIRYGKPGYMHARARGSGFSVVVKTLQNTEHTIYNLEESDPVWYLKARLQDTNDIQGYQELFFRYMELPDHKNLKDYGIKQGSRILLITETDDHKAVMEAKSTRRMVEKLVREVEEGTANVLRVVELVDSEVRLRRCIMERAKKDAEKVEEATVRVGEETDIVGVLARLDEVSDEVELVGEELKTGVKYMGEIARMLEKVTAMVKGKAVEVEGVAEQSAKQAEEARENLKEVGGRMTQAKMVVGRMVGVGVGEGRGVLERAGNEVTRLGEELGHIELVTRTLRNVAGGVETEVARGWKERCACNMVSFSRNAR
ncbi:hypothetical protein DL765_000749 [Monosporascus sp. GIB2]|nr:hypothetical protein DL765_000749 [Monosporascus sp. GIB2]